MILCYLRRIRTRNMLMSHKIIMQRNIWHLSRIVHLYWTIIKGNARNIVIYFCVVWNSCNFVYLFECLTYFVINGLAHVTKTLPFDFYSLADYDSLYFYLIIESHASRSTCALLCETLVEIFYLSLQRKIFRGTSLRFICNFFLNFTSFHAWHSPSLFV